MRSVLLVTMPLVTQRVNQLDQTNRRASAGDLRTQWRLRTSLRPGACSCADASQPGASKSGESICPRSWYFSQDRSDRRPSALRPWSSDEATDNYGVKSGARAFARTRKANAVT